MLALPAAEHVLLLLLLLGKGDGRRGRAGKGRAVGAAVERPGREAGAVVKVGKLTAGEGGVERCFL